MSCTVAFYRDVGLVAFFPSEPNLFLLEELRASFDFPLVSIAFKLALLLTPPEKDIGITGGYTEVVNFDVLNSWKCI